MEILIDILCFFGLVIMQAFFINGVHYCFEKGNIFSSAFTERNKNKWWAKPIWACVRCQSSVWGAITFWIPVIFAYGFRKQEIFIFVADVFILIPLNWIIYKKM